LTKPEHSAILLKDFEKWSTNIIKYKIVDIGEHPGIYFGLTRPIKNLNKDMCKDEHAFGFRPGVGKCSRNGIEPYGKPIKKGDIVTMIHDRDNSKLSFLINDEDLGVAFYSESLNPGRYIAVIGLYNVEDVVEILDWTNEK